VQSCVPSIQSALTLKLLDLSLRQFDCQGLDVLVEMLETHHQRPSVSNKQRYRSCAARSIHLDLAPADDREHIRRLTEDVSQSDSGRTLEASLLGNIRQDLTELDLFFGLFRPRKQKFSSPRLRSCVLTSVVSTTNDHLLGHPREPTPYQIGRISRSKSRLPHRLQVSDHRVAIQ
jgi:hypothetical protein